MTDPTFVSKLYSGAGSGPTVRLRSANWSSVTSPKTMSLH